MMITKALVTGLWMSADRPPEGPGADHTNYVPAGGEHELDRAASRAEMPVRNPVATAVLTVDSPDHNGGYLRAAGRPRRRP